MRPEHLARLRDAGTIIEAGAFADMSASLLFVRAANEEAVSDLVREDVYHRSGVWSGFRVRAFGRMVRLDELEPD